MVSLYAGIASRARQAARKQVDRAANNEHRVTRNAKGLSGRKWAWHLRDASARATKDGSNYATDDVTMSS